MKNSKLRRALLLVASAVLLVSISVSATLAYLTSKTEVVTNTFSVGNVTITLDETDTDNSTPDKDRDTANKYEHLKPNDVLDKDPIVHVGAESEDCYLFVKVVNGLEKIESTATNEPNIVAQMNAKGWFAVTGVEGLTNVYCYYGPAGTAPLKVTKGANITVFETVYISEKAHNDAEDTQNADLLLSKYEGAKIEITAYAIQADGWTNPTAAQLWQDGGFN